MLHFDVLSLFPALFKGPLDESILKKAQEKGLVNIQLHDIRAYTLDKFHRVDDRPYGGGPGMVMMADPVTRAIKAHKKDNTKVIYLSPRGVELNAQLCRQLAQESHIILLCGHYEGIDERALSLQVDQEVRIGDYVLTNGALAACVVIDAVSRFIPGVLGASDAKDQDSFENFLLDWPHYTRPEIYEGLKVPDVLLSGNHEEILQWRKQQALEITRRLRPELYVRFIDQQSQEKEQEVEAELEKIVILSRDLKKSIQFFKKWFSIKAKISKNNHFSMNIDNRIFYFQQGESSTTNLTIEIKVKKEQFLHLLHKINEEQKDATFYENHLVLQDPDGNVWRLRHE